MKRILKQREIMLWSSLEVLGRVAFEVNWREETELEEDQCFWVVIELEASPGEEKEGIEKL